MTDDRDILDRAREPIEPGARMEAYYYVFDHTGIGAIDRVLSEVADAGKAYHNTSDWTDEYEPAYARRWAYGDPAACHVERIQVMADRAARVVRELADALEAARESASHWEGLWRQDQETAATALRERDEALAEVERLRGNQRVEELEPWLGKCKGSD